MNEDSVGGLHKKTTIANVPNWRKNNKQSVGGSTVLAHALVAEVLCSKQVHGKPSVYICISPLHPFSSTTFS